jgi:hypothetical protein
MTNDLDSITTDLQPPTVADQKAQRQAHVAILKVWFTANPLQEISAGELEKLVGRNYQQRISELRAAEAMRIENVPHALELADGTRKKLSGGYRFVPYEKLGRDAAAYTVQTSLFGDSI